MDKSPGQNIMHQNVLTDLAWVLVDPLSLKPGKMPSVRKLAAITAIFKNKGNKQSAGNHRPVSLISIACKIMESIIRESIFSCPKENAILTNKQFGFLEVDPRGAVINN